MTPPRDRRRSRAGGSSAWLHVVVIVFVVGCALLLGLGSVVARQMRTAYEPVPELVAALPTLTHASAGASAVASPSPASFAAAAPTLLAATGTLNAILAEDTRMPAPSAASATGTAASATVAATTRLPATGDAVTATLTGVTTAPASQPAASGSPAPTPTHSPEPAPTASPNATGVVNAIFVRNDQVCPKPQTGELYIFGELANRGAVPYDIDDVRARIFGASGELSVPSQQFDMPGNFFVPPGDSLPFVLVVRLDPAQFRRYQIDVAAEPGSHMPRSDLTVEAFQATRRFDLVEVSGRWAHGGARPDQFVTIVAAVYDAQGRVSNMSYLYLPAGTLDSGNLPAGQYRFESLYLQPGPCSEGTLRVSIVGE